MEKAYLITENTNFTKLKSDIDNYDRLYFGDAYCDYNLLYFLNNKEFIENIFFLNKPLTLVTPIISNKNIDKLFNFIDTIKDVNGLEIVVNDYGVLNRITKNYQKIKLIWGNFLSGQNKDPFLKVFKDKDIHKKISIDNEYYKNLLNEYNIDLIEIYNTFQNIETKMDFNFSIYFPYVVYSINRYCPVKLIFDKKDYLTVIENCDGCIGKNPKNFDMKLKMKTEISKNFFRGNKQFYLNENLIDNIKIKRIVYNYDLLG